MHGQLTNNFNNSYDSSSQSIFKNRNVLEESQRSSILSIKRKYNKYLEWLEENKDIRRTNNKDNQIDLNSLNWYKYENSLLLSENLSLRHHQNNEIKIKKPKKKNHKININSHPHLPSISTETKSKQTPIDDKDSYYSPPLSRNSNYYNSQKVKFDYQHAKHHNPQNNPTYPLKPILKPLTNDSQLSETKSDTFNIQSTQSSANTRLSNWNKYRLPPISDSIKQKSTAHCSDIFFEVLNEMERNNKLN